MKIKYQLTSTRNLDITEDIFKSYPDPTYLMKITKLNRPAIEARSKVGNELLGLLVLDKRSEFMKICLVITHECFKYLHLGNILLRIVISMFDDDFQDAKVLYTVCPHHFETTNYQDLLLKNGFQLTSVKANGDLLYTYERSVQKSNRKN